MIDKEVTNLLRELIIKTIGIEKFNKHIAKIADILNDLEYKDVDLPVNTMSELVLEILKDKTHCYYRKINQSENSTNGYRYRSVHYNKPTYRKTIKEPKWKWKSTAEKIRLLQIVEQRRSRSVPWQKIRKELGLDARSLVYNIILARVYATKIEMKLAHQIWENMHHAKNDGFHKMQLERVKF